jgi:hypothetical protein
MQCSTNLFAKHFEGKDTHCVQIYKLDPTTKSGSLFYVLKKSDFLTKDSITFLKLLDTNLLDIPGESTSLYVLGESHFVQEKGQLFNNQFVLYKFELGPYQLEYKMDSITFQEDLKVKMEDIQGNTYNLEITLNLFKNAKLYLYVIINAVLFLVLLILCCFTYCIYRKRKLTRELGHDSYDESYYDSNSQLDTSKSFVI